MSCHTLFKKNNHVWLVFSNHVEKSSDRLSLNHHVICAGSSVTLIDPGGVSDFPVYLSNFSQQISLERVNRIILTSLDAAATSSLSLWLQVLPKNVKILVPNGAVGRLSHLDFEENLKNIADAGEELEIESGSKLNFIPTNHLQSPLSISIYDTYSRVLYSGMIGQNSFEISFHDTPFLSDLNETLPSMVEFHDFWFPKRSDRKQWVELVKTRKIDFIAPLTGGCFRQKEAHQFLEVFGTMKEKYTAAAPSISTAKSPGPTKKTASIGNNDTQNSLARLKPEDMLNQHYRLITRSDFDGLVCAIILEELGLIDDILFAHPNQMQEGEVPVSENDISTNLPYVPGVFAVFDHHISEINRLGALRHNHIIDPAAPSASRVLFNFFGGKKNLPNIADEMLAAVDQADSAKYAMEDVLSPNKWTLLNFVMDPRTGLGRFQGFRIPNYELMMNLIDLCRENSIVDVLEHPDVKERIDFYFEQESLFKNQIKRCSTTYENVVVIDLKDEDTIHVGNRFMVYALYPECNVSIHVMWGLGKQKTVFSCGKSIFDRTLNTNIGELMLTYGGGGHSDVGSCYVENSIADEVKSALIQSMTSGTS